MAGLVAVPAIVAGAAIAASLSRGPTTPPVASRIPDLAFLVPGVRPFVVWEARRDARRAVRSEQGLLLGYLHHANVGDLDGCVAGEYQSHAESQALPEWLGHEADGLIMVECGSPPDVTSLQMPVLECGNPVDEYQIVYGRTFNHEILRLVASGTER